MKVPIYKWSEIIGDLFIITEFSTKILTIKVGLMMKRELGILMWSIHWRNS